MSYFNDDQQSYMRDLATVPRDERCACGWYLLGECLHAECRRIFADQTEPVTEHEGA